MAKMKNVTVRGYNIDDVPAMAEIWNEVVKEGNAFPQKETLDYEGAKKFFASQTFCGVAEYEGETVGMYILHPNNVGRCGHIANASYAVKHLPWKRSRQGHSRTLSFHSKAERL